jgi:ligand-binding SRPBCC domain-containing protein
LKTKERLCYVQFSTSIPYPIADVTACFNQNLFSFLAPAFPRLKILRYDGQKKDDRIEIELDFGLWRSLWVAHIVRTWQTDDAWGFEDVGGPLPFPFTTWQHQHKLDKISQTETLVTDFVGFRAGAWWRTLCFKWVVQGMLAGRGPQYKRYFSSQLGPAKTA